MLSYLGHLITMIAAFIAVIGNTWDENQPGVRKLTLTGRIAVFVVIAGFTISSVSTYKEEQRKEEAHQVASEEINRHWRALVYPFTLILWEVHGRSFDYSDDTLSKLLEVDTINKIKLLNIRDQAPHYHGMWLEVISESTKNGREGLERASFKYNFILDQKIITAIHKVTSDYYVDVLISSDVYGEPNHIFNNNDTMDVPMPFGNLAAEKFYLEYIRDLKNLKEEIDEHLD
ncbi:TPA: hypothetical protein NJ023_004639 [Vibrio parahaemolyticus]|nr:hypothetical protein [Vibrio parahaemolyticus]HCG5579967.1 hypothetical protein [Vibrio parahaemolyticus]